MAKPMPVPQMSNVGEGITLLRPLSHRAEGPGLIVLSWDSATPVLKLEDGIPSLSMKWAEEGYTVVEIRKEAWSRTQDPIGVAIAQLASCDKCQPKNQIGLVGVLDFPPLRAR